MSDPGLAPRATADQATLPPAGGKPAILRYTARQRMNHWLIVITFLLTAASGLALFHPALFGLSGLVGGGPWDRILHPFFGLTMVLLFIAFAATLGGENRLGREDLAWLRQVDDVVAGREERLPEVGRNNAGQKLVFLGVIGCLSILLPTGIVIWRAYFAAYFPIPVIRWAALLHALFAFVLISTILIHAYAAIWVKGSIHAMTRGTVTPGWAFRHHRRWYREIISHAASSRSRPD